MLTSHALYNVSRLRNRRHPNLPPADLLLWERLRDDKLQKLHFTRQRILGDHVVDFYCSAAHLIVEIDAAPIESAADRTRRDQFEARGMSVLRFMASDIYANVDKVSAHILNACRKAIFTTGE